MKLYLCMHSHRHGYDHYLARSNRQLTADDFITNFGIDYEEDREDENLEVLEYNDCIPVIDDDMEEENLRNAEEQIKNELGVDHVSLG